MFLFWIACIIVTTVIAQQKRLGVPGYFLISLLLGPIAVVIVLLTPTNSSDRVPSSKIDSLEEAGAQLNALKRSAATLQSRIEQLEEKLSQLTPSEPAGPEKPEVMVPVPVETTEAEPQGFEAVFGRYWLNRIGVVLFVLGIGLFISYTFQYLGPFAKVSIGYALSAIFFFGGRALEKNNRYNKVAWGILGGAWGLLYLSTYAMYYIPATRIIHNPVLELWLLVVVSFAAIFYNLKYQSWIVTALTFILAFMTVGLGSIDYTSIVYCALISGAIGYISLKLRWHRFLIFGIAGSYATFLYVIDPNIKMPLFTGPVVVPVHQFQIALGILSVSWLIFSVVLLFFKNAGEREIRYVVIGQLLNGFSFAVLGLKELYRMFPYLSYSCDEKFRFLFILSAVYFILAGYYRKSNVPKLTVISCGIAFSLLAASIVVGFPKVSVGFFWLFEMVIIFGLGLYYREGIYRGLALVLGGMMILRLFWFDFSREYLYHFLGWNIAHNVLIFSFAAFCFFFLGILVKKEWASRFLEREEKELYNFFPVVATMLLTVILWREVSYKWLALAWTLEGITIISVGFLLSERMYRLCGLGVFSLACLKLIFLDLSGINTIYKITAFIFLGAVLLGTSLIYSRSNKIP